MARSARVPVSAALGLLTAVAFVLGTAGRAHGVSFPLSVEFDDGTPGNYASVMVVEDGSGGLDFEITLNTSNALLGSNADLNEFYFNLVGSFTGLAVSDDNAPVNDYTLLGPDPSIKGGAGSSFDWGVSFGNGAGNPGNGTLQLASFTLTADQALSLASLDELSNTNNAGMVNVAAHIQSTASASGSETVGGVIPEPSTLLLLALGLGGLAAPRPRAPR